MCALVCVCVCVCVRVYALTRPGSDENQDGVLSLDKRLFAESDSVSAIKTVSSARILAYKRQ